MTKKLILLCLLLLLVFTVSCNHDDGGAEQENDYVDATEHGLSTANSGETNSAALQALIDRLSLLGGGVVYVPSGEYEFCENGTQTIGAHCIKMRSGVSIIGDGETTVFKPVGASAYGLDMFYFNDYLDTGMPVYLEKCDFRDFVIDASGTSSEVYTSAGKGFMFNLFRNCHWLGVTVKNTDATGFGVDCPIDSSITDCVAIGCGKAAELTNGGASGFGIGYGFCDGESISIIDCVAIGNKKFGFFFEHQGRFNAQMYSAEADFSFSVSDSFASDNYYGFGGICASDMTYERCSSVRQLSYGFYFEDSRECVVTNSHSEGEAIACLALKQTESARYTLENISFTFCTLGTSPLALCVDGTDAGEPLGCVTMEGCDLSLISRAVHTLGHIRALTLRGNRAALTDENIFSEIDHLTDLDNGWN